MKRFLDDPVLLILLFATFAFAGILLFVAMHMPSDGQTFTVFSGLASGFAGSVLTRVKQPTKEDTDPKATTQTTTVKTEVHTPEEPAK